MDHKHSLDTLLDRFSADEALPEDFKDLAREWYWPLSRELATAISAQDLRVLGISGSQGSGKSTLASLLKRIFSDIDGFNVVSLSIDDFYLTRQQRQTLAQTVHPLFMTRGVPGTHDVGLAIAVINQLLDQQSVPIPRFDKAADDRLPSSQWDKAQGPVDLIILEGWCLAIPPQLPEQLEDEQNRLEREEDSDKNWRKTVNQSLESDYTGLFQLIDYLVYLQSPNFSAVKRWRYQQECKLANKTLANNDLPNKTSNDRGKQVMDEKALNRFMQHYERLTLHSFNCLPNIADTTFLLNEEQKIVKRSDQQR